MKKLLIAVVLGSMPLGAFADPCLQVDKKGSAGDSRYYDYGKCVASNAPDNRYLALNSVAQQMQSFFPASDPNDRKYSDAERDANRRSIQEFEQHMDERRRGVKMGSWIELNGIDPTPSIYANAAISDAQKETVRQEIGAAIQNGKLLETYGSAGYETPAAWSSTDPVVRWKTCEVATQLARAYAFGDFIKPEEKNPAKGWAIAETGYAQKCGGTAYWLGRIYEEGNRLVAGVDKKLKKFPQFTITTVYDVAILNGYTPAYERIAELYRVGGPERYRGKNWRNAPADSDQLFMKAFQFNKCLQADPSNLVCAKGLRDSYSDTHKNFTDGFTTYDKDKAAYYADYVTKLEGLLPKPTHS